MIPLTISVPQKAASLLTTGSLIAQDITQLAAANGLVIPVILPAQVLASSVPPQIGDPDLQFTYPRVAFYVSGLKNTHIEKFRALSGSITLVADIWASGNLLSQVDQWLHYYVEAVTGILRQNSGDWGDGIFFDGSYDLQFHLPGAGGLGFVQNAKVTCDLHVSRN
jgi:hypothetical protein